MVKIAFKAVKDKELYNKYFKAKEEKQKFHGLARNFFESHDLLDPENYYIRETLGLQLTEEQADRFAGQLKKYTDENGMYTFKKNSKMQKEWFDEVVSKVDMKTVYSNDFWWFNYIKCGSYALWDYGGNVYGYLNSKNQENISLTDDMEQIKLSEYYRVVEEWESENEK